MNYGGQKDGRERQLEKKQEKATHIHASACDKDTHMSGVELDDSTLYGDNDSGFQQALAREKQRKAQRINQKSAHVQELQKKEQDKQKAMLELLGLSNIQQGQKITIQPR